MNNMKRIADNWFVVFEKKRKSSAYRRRAVIVRSGSIIDASSVMRLVFGFLFAVQFVVAFGAGGAGSVRSGLFPPPALGRTTVRLPWQILDPVSVVEPVALRLESFLRQQRLVATFEIADIFAVDSFGQKVVKQRHFLHNITLAIRLVDSSIGQQFGDLRFIRPFRYDLIGWKQ